jgi:8-oxo-dGTP pyrophosphatase MutT (NUDIX family)
VDNQEEPAQLPSFLFFFLSDEEFATYRGVNTLTPATPLRLYEDDAKVPVEGSFDPSRVSIVESGRASRNDVVFDDQGDGVYLAESIPLRFLFSIRPRFERQVSAGGVLARGRGDDVEVALMRTLPRKDAVAQAKAKASGEGQDEHADPEPEPVIKDPREGTDRRDTNRRTPDSQKSGKERRGGRSRRMRGRRRGSRWGANGRLELPKGKLEAGETPKQAAMREVREELGVQSPLTVHSQLTKNHYTFRTPDGKAIFKTVHYFLLTCAEDAPSFTPQVEEGVISVEWWSGLRAVEQVAFPNLKPVLTRALELLKE